MQAEMGPARRAGVALGFYEPDIAPNLGASIRLAACFGAPVHVIEPCGFPFSPHAWRRQAMDYAALAVVERHDSWAAFLANRPFARLIGLSAHAETVLWDVAFRTGDLLLMGRETAGLADRAWDAVDLAVRIPIAPGARSLNVVTAAAIALAEASRQLR